MFKLIDSSVNTREVDSLVPGLKGLLVTGTQRLLLSFGAKQEKAHLSAKEVTEACRNLLSSSGCFGHVMYKRLCDLHPEHHTQS